MTLNNGGTVPVRAAAHDIKLNEALDEGLLAQVMDEDMYRKDLAGMSAIVQEDNMNAAIDMGTSEMEAFFCVCIDQEMSNPQLKAFYKDQSKNIRFDKNLCCENSK